jgi:hypothetical protein
MEVIHHIGVNADATTRAELRQIGIAVDEGFVAFDVAESAPNWPQVGEWLTRRPASHIVWTTFTPVEIAAAPWLGLEADQHQGFPQPRDDEFGYVDVTYDTTDYCPACGIGLRQKAPFQMKGDPNMGRRGILQMHWVYDEFFAKSSVWESVLKPFGVASMLVTKPSGAVLGKVVQIVNDEVVPVDVAGLGPATGEPVRCPTCGRPKYGPVVRGPLPAPLAEPRGHIVRSEQWFGSGASAYREVLISAELVAALRAADVRGASFLPATRRAG